VPAYRARQARRFPATRPHSPVMQIFWTDANPDKDTFVALQGLAADTAYVGHSASLTRCLFSYSEDASSTKKTNPSKRRIYPGRFVELKNSYEVFVKSGGKAGRPL